MAWQDSLIGGALGIANTGINYGFNRKLQDRQAEINEQAAKMADRRTRQLFTDFESPAAQARQLREAGLSVGLMYGQGGMGGGLAQGAQSAGVGLPQVESQMLEGMALMADINKTKAETQKIKAETDKTEVEKTAQELQNNITAATTEVQIKSVGKQFDALCAQVRKANAESDVAENTKEDNIKLVKETAEHMVQQVQKVKKDIKLNDAQILKCAQEIANLKLQHDILKKDAVRNSIYSELIESGWDITKDIRNSVELLIDTLLNGD